MRGFQKENLRLFCITLVSLKKNLFDFCVLISLVFTLFGYLNCLTQC